MMAPSKASRGRSPCAADVRAASSGRSRDASYARRTERHHAKAQRQGARLRSGAWTAAHARELEEKIDDAARRYARPRRVDIDMGKVERLDTFGAWLMERLMRGFTARGSTTHIMGLSDAYRGLMDELHGVNREAVPAAARGPAHCGGARDRPRRRRHRPSRC